MPIRNGEIVEWRYHRNINQFIRADGKPTSEKVRTTCNSVAELVENDPIFEEFEYRYDFRNMDDLEEADSLLAELYNFADQHLIWLGV